MLKEQELRIHRAEGRDEEQDAGNDERPLAAEVGSKESGEGGTDNAAHVGGLAAGFVLAALLQIR